MATNKNIITNLRMRVAQIVGQISFGYYCVLNFTIRYAVASYIDVIGL